MYRILLVEDSKVFGLMIKKRLTAILQAEITWVQTLSETVNILNGNGSDFSIALLDLNLPDAPSGEIVDIVISKDIPSIIFTGEYSDNVRRYIWSKKNVVDYVMKEDASNIEYIASLIRRIRRNRYIKVLVTDDSAPSRNIISELLNVHQYIVFEASDGTEAVEIINRHPDIKLVITDFEMPYMDGIQLTKYIRRKYKREEVAIIGLSAHERNMISARFIKSGANDFICKPFVSEEFYCRITQNIEIIENIQKIKELSNRDCLTNLHNRRYFFEYGHKLFANAKRRKANITIAMIDIDFFKKVNDNYGHDTGDEVLINVARILKNRFRECDIVARFGGEEFCILAADMAPQDAYNIFENLRETIERTQICVRDKFIASTVSIGVCSELKDSLEEMIKQADLNLYKAKKTGRNRMISE